MHIFRKHRNVALFEGKKGFVSIGIGPVWFSNDFVKNGPPDKKLRGDMQFAAERMGIGRVEFRIFNDFMQNHWKPKEADWKWLAKEYLRLSNCGTILPKLPWMLKHHHKQWQGGNVAKLAYQQVKVPFEALLKDLAVSPSLTSLESE